jgi:prophage tail gpP-like protein
MTTTLLELDDRKRASLARIAEHDRYLVTVEPDGTIVLTPAVVMSAAEASYLSNQALAESIEEARRHPEQRRPRPPRRAGRTA